MEQNLQLTSLKKLMNSKFISDRTCESLMRFTLSKDITPWEAYKKGVLDAFSLFGFKKPSKHPEEFVRISKHNQANLAALLKYRDCITEIVRYTEDDKPSNGLISKKKQIWMNLRYLVGFLFQTLETKYKFNLYL